ncbi:YoaK family protein [Microbacterium sp. GXF0217]
MTRLARDLGALLALTFATGLLDAVSYLALDGVFTGNMTGNVLFIGFAATGVDGIPLLNNVVALAGFVVGSILSGRIVPRGRADHLERRALGTLLGCSLVIAAVALLWLLVGTEPLAVELGMTAALAAAMGAQVSAVKPLGNSDVTTIVVTNTLANLARDSRLGGGRGQAWFQRLGAVVSMGAGAAAGSLLLAVGDGPLAVGAAAILVAAVALLLCWHPREV